MKFPAPRNPLNFVGAVLLVIGCWANAPAQVYVAYANSGVVSEFDADSGAIINEMFILGLKQPHSMCVAHGMLYVVQRGTGTIGTYDLHTGAAIRPELVPSLNMPQAMTVSGDAIYVSDFDWQTSQPRIGKYNALTGAVINSWLVKITGAVINGITMMPTSPNALAVSGNRLIVANGESISGLSVFDATTGALITDRFVPFLSAATGLEVAGNWLYLDVGRNAPMGAIFKLDPVTGSSPFGIPGFPFPRPMVTKLDFPGTMAVSGDSLFVGEGPETAIGKYNATTGDVINAKFIPSESDRLGGLAVVPRGPTEEESAADAKFEWKKALVDYGFVLMEHRNEVFVAVCAVMGSIALGVLALAFRQRAPMPAAPVAELTAEKSVAAPEEAIPAEGVPTSVEESPQPVEDAPYVTAQPPSRPRLLYVAMAVLILTLLAVATMVYAVFGPSEIGPTLHDTRDSERIGAWGFDSSETGEADEKPVLLSLNVYPNEADYSEGSGSYTKAGKWHNGGFWIENDDGSGETEIARLIDPLDIEVHVHAFIPSRSDMPVLYKQVGSAAEVQAVAAKYPSPLTYPPAKGVITYDMTEYDLNMLPWKPDYLSAVGEQSYSRGTLYHFHSDDPKIPPLEVTLMNRHVVKVSGGYP